jgi:prepilin-type N-terminal cleavage/methylation domain-containing protein
MKMFHRGEKGFTLIELLIVVAILGIIAAVIIPNISRFMTTGQLSAANSEAENVKTAALGYFGEYGEWPTSSLNLTGTGYITGSLKAVYTIDPNCGWLVSATTEGMEGDHWPETIAFKGGQACDPSNNIPGQHGRWERA